MIESWLKDEIVSGLQKLYALRLPGTPPADAIKGTGIVWLDAISSMPAAWDADQDIPRIRHAFSTLLRTADNWPSPRRFIDAMPQRRQQQSLPAPKMTEQQRQANIARIQQIKSTIRTNLYIKE